MEAKQNKSKQVNKKNKNQSLSYSDSGVSIDAGNELVTRIKPIAANTHAHHRANILGGVGGFGALYELPIDRFQNPVLVSATDGVGSKLKLATALERDEEIGIDLVAMCVNDIIVCAAEPIYFLDYLATGELNVEQAERIIKGIGRGCEQAGCALVGGETAEMPGMYASGEYDVAGFAVGIVDKKNILNPAQVQVGDIILGLQSSGPHSNGYSLIRKILELSDTDLSMPFTDNKTLGDVLLEPTRIYVKSILGLLNEVEVAAICHITGGGLIENPPRVLPANTTAEIHRSAWEMPEVFKWLQQNGNIDETEMLRTFNCGIGMLVVVHPRDSASAISLLEKSGETVFEIGKIGSGEGDPLVNIVE